MVQVYKGNLLKNKKKKGKLLSNESKEPYLQEKKYTGKPLWLDDQLNEEKLKQFKLNENE